MQRKSEEEKYIQEQLLKQEVIKRQIQQALNEQTYDQFRIYAEQQYPGMLYRLRSIIMYYILHK